MITHQAPISWRINGRGRAPIRFLTRACISASTSGLAVFIIGGNVFWLTVDITILPYFWDTHGYERGKQRGFATAYYIADYVILMKEQARFSRLFLAIVIQRWGGDQGNKECLRRAGSENREQGLKQGDLSSEILA